ncbi:phosphatase 1 regulatory subunit 3A [Labeo rohita]|uniref:Phosphatase 1 regulatory subunit 3A n=1 Tax=Labeo rohita TaxID=84645 RepID=A0A498MV55_LABRO|nr:phosphatase 1 regulatory subunit 3A [Labeo rohita]
MSGDELVLSMVSSNPEPPICKDWIMKISKKNVKLEKKVDGLLEGNSGDESEEVEPEPPPVAARRKVSFADAFGLNLVSVKEYDNRASSGLDGRQGEEYYISCLFNIPVLHQDMEVRLQQQKLELERIELLPGSTTIRGIVRVLNLSFHKAVYVRVTLDGWQSHFELLAEYMPGSSDGETDCFSFHLVLMPPFQVEGLRVEFCLRYESAAGTFWANNGGTNYIVFCYQRRRSDLKEKESEKEKMVEESNQKEQVTPKAGHTSENKPEKEAGINSCKSLKDCCKTLVDRRRKRRAVRLANAQDYFDQKEMEAQMGGNSSPDESTTSTPRLSIPSRTKLPVVHSRQGYGMDTPPILMYHQIPLLSLDWGSTTTTPPQANPPDACSETSHQVEDHQAISASEAWEAFLNSTDTQEQVCVPPESEAVVPTEDERAEKDHSQESAGRKAMETIKSDPVEPSKDLSTSPSRDQELEKEPRVTTLPCSAQGSEPERAGSELETSRDHQAPHHEHTSGSQSQDTTKANPGDETRTARDTETQNSEAEDGISPEECTGSSDTLKVKENTHRAVKDTLTFTGIGDVPLTNRQAEGSSEKENKNKDDSEEQVEMRAFCRELHEGSRKGQDETSTDHSAEIQSVSSCESEAFIENELCTSNKSFNKDNSELLEKEERRFEANEGLKLKERMNEMTAGAEEDEMHSETKRELVEDSQVDGGGKEFEIHATKLAPSHVPIYPKVSTDTSKHIHRTTSSVTSAEEDFELGKTLRNFQEPQRLDGEDELSTPLPSIHLSCVDGNGCMLLREFCSLGHTTKALVYAILFVIFIAAYLYDLTTCMALYLFSLFWWCSQGMKQRLDVDVDVD